MQDHSEKYIEECNSWKRLLDFLQTENLSMKNRLTDMIPYISKNTISNIERYQNVLLTKDIAISLYRKDVVDHVSKIRSLPQADAVSTQYKLRDEIKKLEHEFSKFKYEFNNYLLEL